MKNWVAFHGGREVQLISMAGYFLNDFQSPKPFEVELG